MTSDSTMHCPEADLRPAAARHHSDSNAVRLVRAHDISAVTPTFPQLAFLVEPSRTSLNMCSAMWIAGPLDEGALERALIALVDRHDALRATFSHDGSQAWMHLGPSCQGLLRTIRLTDEGDQSVERRAETELHDERRRQFDLANGPPVRALLMTISPLRHLFALTVHHLVADKWSINIIKRDLACLYEDELTGSTTIAAGPQIRFIDFAHWQARLHATEQYSRQLDYWRRELADVERTASSAGGEAFAPGSRIAPEYVDVLPPEGFRELIERVAVRRGCTAYALLMTALQLSLAEYFGTEQQVVWSPVSRRSRAEIEQSVGMYTNLIMVATRVRKEITLWELLGAIARKVLMAYVNGDVSALTAVMQAPEVMPAMPLIGLNFVKLPNECGWRLAGTSVSPINLRGDDGDGFCALEALVRFDRGRMSIVIKSKTEVFPPGSGRRIGAGLLFAVESIAAAPDMKVGDFMEAWRERRSAIAALPG